MLKIYSIHDKKTDTWSTPFFSPTDVHACRSFTAAVSNTDPNNMLNQYPHDFTLNTLGQWDETDGMISAGLPSPIITGDSALRIYAKRTEPENLNA